MHTLGIVSQTARLGALAVEEARRVQPTVVFSGQIYPTGAAAARAARALGVPYAAQAYGEEFLNIRLGRGALSPVRRRVLRTLLRDADLVIGPSTFTRSEAARFGYPPARFHVVHPGVALHAFRPDVDGAPIRARHGLGPRPVILSCGRLFARKGMDVVIRLLPEIARRVPDVAYVIVGDGPDRSELEQLARTMGVTDRVIITGEVEQVDLPQYYAAADVIAMAYRERSLARGNYDTEGFGIVLAEAGAAGRPTVAVRVGGTGDAVIEGETGYLLEEDDTQGFTDALVRLLGDPALRARLGAGGRARVERELNWESMADRVRAILVALMEASAPVARPG